MFELYIKHGAIFIRSGNEEWLYAGNGEWVYCGDGGEVDPRTA